jgi:phage-related minor tail protein
MATEVGVGFVRLVPSMRGFASEAQRLMDDALRGPARQAGQTAGDGIGQGLRSGADSGARGGADAATSRFGALKGGLAAIGIAAGAALAAGLSEAMDQSRIVGRLQAQLGATPAEAEKIGKVAGSLYANAITEDFQGAADAISATMRAGLTPPGATNAQLESIATKVSDLSSTFELDLGQAANAVGQIMKTGLAPNAQTALDVITRGLQEMGPRADDIADTFNEYSVIFQRLGFDATTATGLLSQGLKAGARDTDVVADALKEFTIEGVAGSQKMVDGFAAVGLSSGEMISLLSQGGPKATQALQMTLDALRAMEDPVKRDAAAAELFGTKSEDMQLALLALDPSTATDALGKVGGAADEMGDALRDNAGTKVEAFKRQLTQGFVEFLGGTVIPAAENFKNFLGRLFDGIDFAGFVETIRPAFDTIKSIINDAKSTFADMAAGSGMSMSSIRTVIEQTLTKIGQIITAAAALIKAVWDRWGEDIMRTVVTAWTTISGFTSGALQVVRGVIQTVTALIRGDWSQVWNGIETIIGGVFKAIGALVSGAMTLLRNGISSALSTIAGTMSRSWQSIRNSVATAWNWIYGKIRDSMNSARQAVSDRVSKLVADLRGLPGKISSAVGSLKGLLYNKGRDVVSGIWNGIVSMGGWLRSQLISWVRNQIPGPIADALGIGSPSKVMADLVGRWIPAGIVEGWRTGLGEITAMGELTAAAAIPALPAAAGGGGRVAAAAGPMVVIDGTGLHRALAEWLRDNTRVQGGGSVQKTYGQRRR